MVNTHSKKYSESLITVKGARGTVIPVLKRLNPVSSRSGLHI